MKSGRHRINNGRSVSYSSLRAYNTADADKVDPRSLPGSGPLAPADANGSGPPGGEDAHAANVNAVGNGNGHANGNGHNGSSDLSDSGTVVAGTPVHAADEQVLAGAEAPAPPLQGIDLVRYGAREIAAGLGDLALPVLGLVRRHLPPPLRTIRLRRLGLVLALVVVAALATVIVGASTVLDSLRGPTSVIVATAGPGVIENEPGGVGTISAAPQDIATVSLDVQGVSAPIEVTAVDVLANQQVAAGTPLLQLNPVPFEQNIVQVQLTLDQAEQALRSAQAAAKTPAGSADGYLAVQAPTLAGQVALDQQLLQIAQGNSSSITSPIAGYVAAVRVAAGQVVAPGNTLVQVVDPVQVVVNAGMQLSDLQSISVGDAATITPSQLPGVHLAGTVVAVSAAATGDGLEGTVVVSAPNLATHPVPIGTQSIVNVRAPLRAAVSVPTLAVLNVQIAPVVGVIHDDRIHFQPVEIGASDGRRTQILSGLRAGQRVAITNMQVLTDGDKVKPSSGGA